MSPTLSRLAAGFFVSMCVILGISVFAPQRASALSYVDPSYQNGDVQAQIQYLLKVIAELQRQLQVLLAQHQNAATSSVMVIGPNGGEQIQAGVGYGKGIQWKQKGLSSVSIALYRNDEFWAWIHKEIASEKNTNDIHSAPWLPGDGTYPYETNAAVYKIHIIGQKADGSGYIEDTSDASFSFVTSVSAPPNCTLKTNKESYIYGEQITLSWDSTNASYGIWAPDNSGKDNFKMSADKLTPSGSITFTANVIGNPYVALQVYNATEQSASCLKTIPVHAESPYDVSIQPSAPQFMKGGSPISATWKKAAGASAQEWAALVPAGTTWNGTGPFVSHWVWIGSNTQIAGPSGMTSGTVSFTSTMPPGRYEIVYYNTTLVGTNTYKELARTIAFDVTAPSTGATITLSAPQFSGAITAMWNKPIGARADDWIAVVPEGGSWQASSPVNWIWATSNSQQSQGVAGATSGSITIPSGNPAGRYQLVYYLIQQDASGKYIEAGRSTTFTVVSGTSTVSSGQNVQVASALYALEMTLRGLFGSISN